MKFIGLTFVLSLVLVSCARSPDPTLFIPDTRGLISTDRGNTYKENMKAIEVGEEFYLKFEVSIKTTKKQAKKAKKNLIPFTVKIPATDIFECTLTDYSGNVSITPATDSINNILRYDFTALASDNPTKYSAIFRCKARDEGEHRLEVSFGKQVNEIYSKTMTMVYNKSKNVNNDINAITIDDAASLISDEASVIEDGHSEEPVSVPSDENEVTI
jgi:hypothetical protein